MASWEDYVVVRLKARGSCCSGLRRDKFDIVDLDIYLVDVPMVVLVWLV